MAGTVTKTNFWRAGSLRAVEITCTADASNASYPATDLRTLAIPDLYGTLLAIQTNPGATAPTDNYDIVLNDQDGVDRLNGVGVNRDTVNSERASATGATIFLPGETLTLTITGNAVNSAVTVVRLYWSVDPAASSSSTGGGDATAANQSTMITSLQLIDDLRAQIDDTPAATAVGLLPLAIRDDALTTLTPPDGDLSALRVDSTGALWVNAGTGIAQFAEDSVHVSTDVGMEILGVRNDALATAFSGTNGDYTPIAVSSDGRPYVSPQQLKVISVTPTIDTAIYASGDSLHTADMTFSAAAKYNGGGGTVVKLVVLDTDNEGATGELWLFDATLSGTTHTLNTAWNLADADLSKCIGVIPWGPFYAGSLNQTSVNSSIRLPFKCAAADSALYGVAVTRGTPTYTAATDLTFVLTIAQD